MQGSVGHTGALMTLSLGAKLARYDVELGELVRDKDGWLVEAGPGEAGELLGKVIEGDPLRDFKGYYGNSKATQSKVLQPNNTLMKILPPSH